MSQFMTFEEVDKLLKDEQERTIPPTRTDVPDEYMERVLYCKNHPLAEEQKYDEVRDIPYQREQENCEDLV